MDPIGQARAFIKQAFGSPETLFTLGPNDAFHRRVCQLAAQMQEESEKPDLSRKQYPDVCDRYRVKSKLGSGGTANVHLAVDMKTEKYVALKVYNRKKIRDAENEALVLGSLNCHRNIIGFEKFMEGVCWESKNKNTSMVVFEYAEMGALIEYIVAVRRF